MTDHQSQLNPSSSKNAYLNQINRFLNTAQVKHSGITTRDFQNQLEFYIINDIEKPIKVSLSTKKDPYFQISSLQQILKIAKINNETLKQIDLSSNHPYASFQNN